MTRKPTMSDVAKAAGVGTMTVSRVLNGSPHVHELTAERVRRAIERLRYRPNEMARALRGSRTRSIGVIVPYLYDPFFATCAHEINVVAKSHGYSVILTTSNEDPDAEYCEAQLMLQRHVEGLIVIPASQRHSKLTRAEFENTPIVTLDRPEPSGQYDSVLVHNRSGSRQAVEHLINRHGHKRIVLLGRNQKLYTLSERLIGYRKAMRDHGLEPESSFECSSPEVTGAVLEAMLQRVDPPTAFFTANNLTTRYVLAACNKLKIRVPEDIAIVGFDDFELAELLQPTLTVVWQPAAEIGRVAAELLFDRLGSTDKDHKPMRMVLPVKLVVRRSCGCEE
ncbi:MAG: LacI family transcriptional regulator [Acidobacteria bacterium]|uniref:LacI family transcriptional regulator n=2 Tax=Acidipila rosea TaxID=768535 RepID=A0A4R1LA49_9BACT|nr:LacI family transcriptional regulator [Acidobacteriota bacterium]TCK73853.1 LacI family transcriptional regulator [Acidipila rosea]